MQMFLCQNCKYNIISRLEKDVKHECDVENFTFAVDTWHILGGSSRTAGATGGEARLFFSLPQVAGGILTGDEFHQVRASLQRTVGLP